MTKLYKKYASVKLRGFIKETEIISLRSLLSGWKNSTLTADEIEKLRGIYAEGNCRLSISEEQSEKGLAWLKNIYKTPKGKIRKSNPFDSEQIAIIENYSHWTFEGLADFTYELDPNGYAYSKNRRYFFPVFRINSKDGKAFQYAAHSWQTGLKTEFGPVTQSKKRKAG